MTRRGHGRGEEGRGGEAREAAAEGDDEGRAEAELELAEGSQESRQERRRDEHARECGREPGRGEHGGSEDASEARCPEERRPQERRDDPTDPARNEQSADQGQSGGSEVEAVSITATQPIGSSVASAAARSRLIPQSGDGA